MKMSKNEIRLSRKGEIRKETDAIDGAAGVWGGVGGGGCQGSII